MNRLYTNPSGSQFVEFAKARPSQDFYREVATREIDSLWSSFYDRLPNPDPVLRKTGNAIDVLDVIRREPHVSATSTSRESGAMLRKWKLDPGTASTRSVELLERLFENLPLRQILRELLEAWGYGYQVSEIIWERQGDLLLPAKVIGKPQRWFFFGKENELRIMKSIGDITGSPVEDRKFLLTQYRASYDNPYGEAQYSMCFWPVTFKKGGLKFWSVFLEKFGMPHAHAKLPPSASDTDRRGALAALQNMVRDACAVFPDNSTIEFIEASNVSGSAEAFEKFARYHDGQISTVILGHSSAADSTPGKLGGEDNALQARADLIDNDCAMIQDSMNRLIQWIYELNPSLGADRCSFELYTETDVDPERAERDSKLMETGRVKLSKSYFVKRYDFEEDDIEVIEPAVAQAAPGAQFAAPRTKKPAINGQAEVDAILGTLTDEDLQSTIELVLKPVVDLVNRSGSYEDLKEGVAGLYPKLDTSGIEALLEKAMLLAESAGRIEET